MGKLKISSGFSLKRLDLAIKGVTNTALLGNYKSAFKGSGLEFEQFRKYNPSNDDASRIDWKASRRTNQLLVREFREERNVEIIFVVDVSSQMLTGSTKRLKAEYAAEVISTLSQSVLMAGDSVGMIMFADGVSKELTPQRGMAQYYAITNELTKVSNYGGYGDTDKALNLVFNKAEEGSMVFLISDFVNGLNSEHLLKLSAKKFDLIVTMVRDPRDMSLPTGAGEVFLEDPHTGDSILVEPRKIRKVFAREVISDIKKTRKLLDKYGADFLFLETEVPFVNEIIKFFKRREAAWR